MASTRKVAQEAKIILGMNLHDYMRLHDLTQKEMAEMFNIKESTLSGYLSGRRYPELTSLRTMAQALGVRVSDLTGEELDNNIVLDKEVPIPPEYQALSKEDRQIIDAFIRELYRIHQG